MRTNPIDTSPRAASSGENAARATPDVARSGNMPRIAIPLALIGASAITAGGYAAFYPSTSAIGDALQRVAEEACRCARTKGGSASCWAELDRVLPSGGDMISACFPISQQQRCGRPEANSGNKSPFATGTCVTTRYEYMSSAGEPISLCSKKEAQSVERAWNTEAVPDASGQISTPIADQLARDIVAGKSRKPIDGPKSCTE